MDASLPSSIPAGAPDALVEPVLVACLCAQWCRTCDAYRDTLAAVRDTLAASHAAASLKVMWIDIEDEADLVGDLDIEDFPTLLIARGDRVVFFGPVMPHAQTLDRLVRNAWAGDAAPAVPDAAARDVDALRARLAAHATF